jgi:hypothetical protein
VSNAAQVIAKARRYLGTAETPPGSNRGPDIDRWQRFWGMSGQPWCGMFADAMFREAGVDDDDMGHPSTWTIYANARAKGRLRPEPVPGCFVVWDPGPRGHVEIAVRRVAPGIWRTIGGNTGDMVREHDRSVAGAYFCVPSALTAAPSPPVYRTEYSWQDLDAKPVMHGPWATKSSREAAIARWVAAHGNPGHVRRGRIMRRVNGVVVPRWVFWTGQRAASPWLASKARRDADLERVRAQRPGHRFRTVSRRVRVT